MSVPIYTQKQLDDIVIGTYEFAEESAKDLLREQLAHCDTAKKLALSRFLLSVSISINISIAALIIASG